MGRVSVIIPGRCEPYFQETIDSVLERATGDVEVVAIVDGPGQAPMVESDDPRVKIIVLDKSIGQRAAYNLGVRESSGEFVMKIDAHALLSPGFDEVLQSHCPPRTTVIPEMRRLDVHTWKDKPRGHTHFMFFGLDMYCHFWRNYRRRPEAQVEYPETMNSNGSCWFCRREWNDHIGLLDEGVGSWGNVGIEVSLRTWLCGGSQIVNKGAWQAHWFRKDEGGFTYPMDGRKVAKAHKYTRENYYFNDHAFENQTRPFGWIIHHFAPVPGWEAYMVDEFKSPRVIIYYTDSQLEPRLAGAVRKQIRKAVGPIPIISVSQEPLKFGKNICVGKKPKLYRSMYEQLLVGLEAAPEESICYLCEHDVFYHPSHFAHIPKRKTHAYFNRNRYHFSLGAPNFLPARGKRALSQCVAYREMLIDHCKERLALWDKGIDNRMRIRFFTFASERPNVDIRHGENLTPDGSYKRNYRRGVKQGGEVKNLPGWGSPGHFQKKTGYTPVSNEVMRWDIVQHLMKQNNYQRYLEIGVDKGKTFRSIRCKVKHGVDPRGHIATHRMTSDDFFAQLDGASYDLIFIDGLHEAEQVKRDIANSLEHLASGGTIVMHDCSPRNEGEQRVPRPRRQGIWTGDVWRAFVHYRRRPDLEMGVIDTNNGIGIIRRGVQEPIVVDNPTYSEFAANREAWLNLKSVEEFYGA
jgi:glycosyltransferase involved in cell wall biosynthesis